MRLWGRRLERAGVLLAALWLAGCASAPPDVVNGAIDDPFERSNRTIFAFNNTFNKYVTLPVAWIYVYHFPGPLRHGINNALANLESPVTFTNDVLQGHIGRAGETLLRFTLNSTIGLAGTWDFAAEQGFPRHVSDFGQTLAIYGVGSGPFLVLPMIGPTTARDTLGAGVDLLADPLFYLPTDWSLWAHAVTAVGVHSLAPFEKHARNIVFRNQLGGQSVDPYGTMRSVYRQQRAQEILGGRGPVIPELPQ
ncbi:MAG: VacJ family lipoprotein [Alphaproteobacteria bacterium]|nr:VacJ family lipoprotein [Alphaproteobacteria bacterium]